jgi:hypothetical protein
MTPPDVSPPETEQLEGQEKGAAAAGPAALAAQEAHSFPPSALVGSLGELARLMSEGTEVPEEFYFACGLTLLGATCSNALGLNVGTDVQPRLYTVLLGESYEVKKSTAMRKMVEFFKPLWSDKEPKVVYGVGSGEGLATKLLESKRLILCYDELRALVDKSKIQTSVLLPMVTSLYEGNHWDNAVKYEEESITVRDVHLSLIGCCTTETFSRMWTTEAISVGFPNRLFVVTADRKRKIAWPRKPNPQELERLSSRIKDQLSRLPITLEMSQEGKDGWEAWYQALPKSEHVKRLDTIGLRLLGLITLITDKEQIGLETVEVVKSILNYEINVRRMNDPIDADSQIAKLEEKIRRVLRSRGPLSRRNLRRDVHGDRTGLYIFNAALENLAKEREIRLEGNGYALVLHEE